MKGMWCAGSVALGEERKFCNFGHGKRASQKRQALLGAGNAQVVDSGVGPGAA